MAMAVIDTVVITEAQFEAVLRKLVERLTFEVFNFRHSDAGWMPAEQDVRGWLTEILDAGDIRTHMATLKQAVVEVSGPEVAARLFRADETQVLPLAQETMTAMAALVPEAELAATIPPAPEGLVEAAEVPKPGEAPRTLRVRLTGKETPDG